MKRALTPLAVAMILTGCSQKPVVNEYSYESQVHSGTVNVHDLSFGDSEKCPRQWREAEQVFKSGLPPMIGMTLKVTVTVQGVGEPEKELPLLVSSGNGNKVTLKDYQSEKAVVVGTETNGLVSQGDLFSYPEGYFLRAAKPDVKGNDFNICLGIDRMYQASTSGTGEPVLQLDRLNLLFNAERGEPKTYVFGKDANTRVRIAVTPK